MPKICVWLSDCVTGAGHWLFDCLIVWEYLTSSVKIRQPETRQPGFQTLSDHQPTIRQPVFQCQSSNQTIRFLIVFKFFDVRMSLTLITTNPHLSLAVIHVHLHASLHVLTCHFSSLQLVSLHTIHHYSFLPVISHHHNSSHSHLSTLHSPPFLVYLQVGEPICWQMGWDTCGGVKGEGCEEEPIPYCLPPWTGLLWFPCTCPQI